MDREEGKATLLQNPIELKVGDSDSRISQV